MRRLFVVVFIIINCFNLSAEEYLVSAELFFLKMKNRDYVYLFENLSVTSQDTIVSEIYDILKKSNISTSKESIKFDFLKGGELSKSYWDSFLKNFNPDMALKDSQWNIGKCESNYCEIVLTYKKSQKPAILKLYKENNIWKIGLVESFWTRKK